MSTVVRTQAELDAAIDQGEAVIEIRSPRGVWLTVRDSKSSSVVARGSSRVEAWGSSRVVASESSSVVARESSSVVAWGSSRVVARGSSRVEAWESSSVVARESSSVVAWGSSRVVARGSSRVEAWESSSVEARESSSVEARGSSSVEAWGSSRVVARESSSVEARGSSRVEARGSSRVVASPKVAVHLYSAAVTLSGGVLIDCTKVDADPREWCDYHGVTVSRAGVATVYKAINDQWTTPRGTDYAPGRKPSAPDWRNDQSCGGGLHFSPTPRQALDYHPTATRFVAVGVRVDDLRPIPGGTAKCKAPRVVRACVEVDIDGKPVAS